MLFDKIEEKFDMSPILGLILAKNKIKFNDSELFKGNSWIYAVLKKIRIWWGSPNKKELSKNKTLLGIQCKYKNIITGEEKESLIHSGQLLSSDIIEKNIELKAGEYFNKFYIGFDYEISYIKFETNLNSVLEFGTKKNSEMKTIKLNNGKNMIQCFNGYYNKDRITALQCKYISIKNFNFINMIDIFRLRHFFKVNEKEKEKWKNKNILNKYSTYIKAVAKLCLLPDNQFYSVIKFLFEI